MKYKMKQIYKSHFHTLTFILFSCLGLFASSAVNAQCTFSISTAGSNPNFVQILVLAESDGTIVEVIDGSSGTFTTPLTGSYNVHALNYDPADVPDPLPMAGDMIENVGSISGCFNDNFANDIKPIECLCGIEPLIASFNAMPGYEIIYVLADSTGLILATNTTGMFTAADGLADDTFIHALHYETANPPSPLPSVGLNISDVGTAMMGCFNAEFTTNPLCVLVSPAPADIPIEIIRVCSGNAIFASLDGETPMDATDITFLWYLDGVLVATIDGSPYYSPEVIGNYTVSAFSNTDCTTYIGDIDFPIGEIIDCKDCN